MELKAKHIYILIAIIIVVSLIIVYFSLDKRPSQERYSYHARGASTALSPEFEVINDAYLSGKVHPSQMTTEQLEYEVEMNGTGVGPGLVDSNRYYSNPPPN